MKYKESRKENGWDITQESEGKEDNKEEVEEEKRRRNRQMDMRKNWAVLLWRGPIG